MPRQSSTARVSNWQPEKVPGSGPQTEGPQLCLGERGAAATQSQVLLGEGSCPRSLPCDGLQCPGQGGGWRAVGWGRMRPVSARGWEPLPSRVTLQYYCFPCRCFGKYQCPAETVLNSFVWEARKETEKMFPPLHLFYFPPRSDLSEFPGVTPVKNWRNRESFLNAVLQNCPFSWLMSPCSTTWIMMLCCDSIPIGNVSNTWILKSKCSGRDYERLCSAFLSMGFNSMVFKHFRHFSPLFQEGI